MAVQAQLYTGNIVFPLASSQDLPLMENAGGVFNDSNFNLQQQKQQQQQQRQQQLQQQQQQQQEQQQLQLQQRQQQLQLQLQQKQQQMMQLTQLRNNDNMQQNMMMNQTCCFDKNVLVPDNISSMVLDQCLPPQMKEQRSDIESLIRLHSERLRRALQEHLRRQQTILLRNYESEAQMMLSQKDVEITKAENRNRELNDFLKRIEMESKTWERVANEKEGIIFDLNNTLNRLTEENARQICNFAVEDEESCCNVLINNSMETATETAETEKRTVGMERNTRKMICKICNDSRNPCSIVLLPCRHLCSCKFCEPYIYCCPVCNMPKNDSIEAML